MINIAVFTCYFPDKKFKNNLSSVAEQFDYVIVMANDGNNEHISLELLRSNIQVHVSKVNLGISEAFNLGANKAKTLNADFICFFDQDSSIAFDFLSKMHDLYNVISTNKPKLILGPNYTNSVNKLTLIDNAEGKYFEEYAIISSGSMMRLDDFYEIGAYDKKLFIDYCDIDFCFRARLKGYHICISTESLMYHDIGNFVKKRALFFNLRYTEHNEIRVWYMFRNSVILSRKYIFLFPRWVLNNALKRIKSVLLIFIFDKRKYRKIVMVCKGIINGLFLKIK